MRSMTKRHWLGTALLALCLVATTGLAVAKFSNTHAAPPQVDLTGVWRCNDGGTYYVRQVGNDIWWYGQGSGFGNVYRGEMSVNGTAIIGEWADLPVPASSASSRGQLDLAVRSANRLEKTGVTGGFGGSVWTR